MGSLTWLNPNAIQDGSISLSKIYNNVASKSYVDEEIAKIGDQFFKSFATLSEYETAVANGEVVYPCISYITEDNVIKFEKSESPYNAIATVTQPMIDLFAGFAVKPLAVNPDYFEIFEVNGEDYLSNTTILEGLSCIPFPSFNLGDTFEIKFKLKDKPQYFVENTDNLELTMLFFYCLSYLEIDESFYNRVTIIKVDGTVKEYPVGFVTPSIAHDFTCKFKGDYGITDKDLNIEVISMMLEGMFVGMGDNPDTPINWTLQIPGGNATYGNPSDMYDENTGAGATFYGIVNFMTQVYSEQYSNLHLIIETY